MQEKIIVPGNIYKFLQQDLRLKKNLRNMKGENKKSVLFHFVVLILLVTIISLFNLVGSPNVNNWNFQ